MKQNVRSNGGTGPKGADRPRLLDLFSGAGGAGAGYARAGFEVVGVDLVAQPRYPFAFVQADALEYLRAHGREFDAIHASPPCQRYSKATRYHPGRQAEHPDLVAPTRELLEATGRSWVIENVIGAPLRAPVMLCGTMFDGLRVYRHRLFEASPPLYFPPWHAVHPERPAPVGRAVPAHGWMTVAGHFINRGDAGGRAMGIDWMLRYELAQAIPPAYTEWVGRRLLEEFARVA